MAPQDMEQAARELEAAIERDPAVREAWESLCRSYERLDREHSDLRRVSGLNEAIDVAPTPAPAMARAVTAPTAVPRSKVDEWLDSQASLTEVWDV